MLSNRYQYTIRRLIYSCAIVFLSLFSNVIYAPAMDRSPQSESHDREWVVIWHDEFDGDRVNPAKWRIEDAALIKNNEQQYYTPEDVYLEDGHLVLRSQQRPMGGRDYTSGLVETKGLFTFTYGRVEVRARLPKGKGIWPAHWMMNAVGTWPPEIDIMEMLGHRPTKIHMTNHFGVHPRNSRHGGYYEGPDYSADFHTYAIEWTPDEIKWFIDGVERFSTRKYVHDVPFYIILNTAVGGNWPGYPDETTEFPQYHHIDYVRVYKKNVPGTGFVYLTAEHGQVSQQPNEHRYALGTTIQLAAKPDIGYKFSHWTGDLEGTQNPLDLTIAGNVRAAAVFAEDPDAPGLISSRAAVLSSSQESDQLGPANVVDGNLGTRWSSEFSDPQWIQIDLGEARLIEAMRLNWENAFARSYAIAVSDDALTWSTVYAKADSNGGVHNIRLVQSVSARYIRLTGTERGTQWGYSLWEFEVFGQSQE